MLLFSIFKQRNSSRLIGYETDLLNKVLWVFFCIEKWVEKYVSIYQKFAQGLGKAWLHHAQFSIIQKMKFHSSELY